MKVDKEWGARGEQVSGQMSIEQQEGQEDKWDAFPHS